MASDAKWVIHPLRFDSIPPTSKIIAFTDCYAAADIRCFQMSLPYLYLLSILIEIYRHYALIIVFFIDSAASSAASNDKVCVISEQELHMCTTDLIMERFMVLAFILATRLLLYLYLL